MKRPLSSDQDITSSQATHFAERTLYFQNSNELIDLDTLLANLKLGNGNFGGSGVEPHIPVPVQERAAVKPEPPGCGSTSVMTVMRFGDAPTVWFVYRPDRKGIHHRISRPVTAKCFRPMLTVVTGVVRIRQNNGSRVSGPCPEKIHDVHARVPSDITTESPQRSVILYAIEAGGRGLGMFSRKRRAARKARVAPLMQSLYDWYCNR